MEGTGAPAEMFSLNKAKERRKKGTTAKCMLII